MSSPDEPAHFMGLSSRLLRKRDFYAGLMMMAFGLLFALKGPSYNVGTLMHMGPGFLPTALGVLLIGLGIAIAMTAIPIPDGVDEDILPATPEWLAWGCILASPIAFIIFGAYGGLAPATFMCVFVASLGDRDATWRGSTLLSETITLCGVSLFARVLQIPMPVFKSVPIEVGSIFIAIAALSYFVFQQNSLRALTSAGLACLAGALYVGGLFVAPASTTFVLAGVLAYLSLRQVHSEALATFAVEGILIFFVVGHASYFIVHALTSFSVVALVASATAIASAVIGIIQLVRIFWITPRYPDRAQNLFGLPSAQVAIALTFIAAVAALEAGYALDAYSSLKGIVL